jgi:hypothetical protein
MTLFGFTPTEILAFIGALSIIFGFIKLLFDVVPRLGSLRAQAFQALATNIKHKIIEKRAIASNIESVVNDSVSHLQRELPAGWISKARIEWVKEESKEDLEEDELILRIRPLEDQDKNLMNGIYYFFTKAIFPGVRRVIPKMPRQAAVLQLSRRTILKNHPYAIGLFEDKFLESAIQREPGIANYVGKYQAMDHQGVFTSVFLREATELAMKIRFSEERSHIAEELDEILKQITTFIKKIKKTADVPDELWSRKTDTYSYAFLLVARPVFWRRVDAYVNRAQLRVADKIDTLYVLGAEKEKAFVGKVVSAITKNTDYVLTEQFELYRDYRGEPGGICALFRLTQAREAS